MLKLREFITGYVPPLLECIAMCIFNVMHDRWGPLNDLFDVRSWLQLTL